MLCGSSRKTSTAIGEPRSVLGTGHFGEPAGQRRHPRDYFDATRRAQIVGRARAGGDTNHWDAGVAASLGIDRHVANERTLTEHLIAVRILSGVWRRSLPRAS